MYRLPKISLIAIGTAVLHSAASAQSPLPPSLIFPEVGLVLDQGTLNFTWGAAPGALTYEIVVGTDSNFVNIIENPAGIAGTSYNASLSGNQQYYWKARSSDGTVNSGWSAIRSFKVFDPTDVTGIQLWLRADSGVIKDGSNKVSQWTDITGNSRHAFQGSGASQPVYAGPISTINNHPVIRFDGTDDFMRIDSTADLGEVYVVVNWNGGSSVFPDYNGIFGQQSGGAEGFLFVATGSTSTLVSTGYLGSNIYMNAAQGSDFSPLSQYRILWGHQNPKTFANFFISSERGNANRFWNGDFSEIIVFDHVLSPSERSDVHSYIRYRYAPPVNLGPDIFVSYGYCDTVLDAGTNYNSYLWSTGETTPSIAVNVPGAYWVICEDVFGYYSSDTIFVSYPGYAIMSDTIVCLGDTISWYPNPGIAYSFQWQDGSTDSVFQITQEGAYHVQIEDSSGCFINSDTVTIVIDSFRLKVSLGPDTSVCAGQNITLTSGSSDATSYLWSTGSTDSSIPILSTGFYSVLVSNSTGCQASDTIIVTVSGQAPTADFSAGIVCLSDTTFFTDLSSAFSPDSIVSWQWYFGDGDSATETNPAHQYADTGTYNVRLKVTTNSGCNNQIIKEAEVLEIPDASFLVAQACINIPYKFTDSSTYTMDSIADWLWRFGDGDSSIIQNPVHPYTSLGNYWVTLMVTNTRGCANVDSAKLTVVSSAPSLLSFTPIGPKDGFYHDNSPITFLWNESPNAVRYDVHVSTSPGFTDTVHFAGNDEGTQYTASGLPVNIELYWRVIAYNLCDDFMFSTTHRFKIFDPSAFATLELWLRADSGLSMDSTGIISQWNDISGNTRHALQGLASNQPIFSDSVNQINFRPAVQFDGINDFMKIDSSASIAELYVVVDWTGGGAVFPDYHGIFGQQSGGNEAFIFLASGGTGNLLNTGFFGDAININTVNTLNFLPFSKYKMLWGSKKPANPFANFFIASERGNAGRYWNGTIAEIMAFSDSLAPSVRNEVQQYLRNRYAPVVNLGPDLFANYGFCDTTLDAGPYFYSYLWSTGETTQSITINKPGKYWVTAEDIFGFYSGDTVEYRHKETFLAFPDTAICLGDTVTWNTNIPHSYSFAWQDASADSLYLISAEGWYRVTITDTLGCSLTDSAFVDVDSFSVQVSLGPDTSLCRGNTIALSQGAAEAVAYLWPDLSTDPSLTIDTAGTYWVNVTNARGCAATDTLEVLSIIGNAPITGFAATVSCINDMTTFSDTSFAQLPDSIVSWTWDFGDGNGSTTQNPQHLYGDTGAYQVTLSVVTDVGCVGTVTEPLFIYPLPLANFEALIACEDAPTRFNDLSQTFNGGDTLVLWTWDFGDSKPDSVQNPWHEFADNGAYTVRLIASTLNGCRDTVEKTVMVKESPVAAFENTNVCDGQVIQFADISIVPFPWTIMSRVWDFGDNKPPNAGNNPLYLYDSAGTYNVTLIVRATSGCIDTLVKPVKIHAIPVAHFTGSDACLDIPFQLTDSSYVAGDSITAWSWDFGGQYASVQQNPVFTPTVPGTFNVKLSVTSSSGCTNSTTIPVTVHSPPIPGFTFSPSFGAPPLNVGFTNTSAGAATYLWRFGDGGTSTAANPSHTYQATGIYDITLIASDIWGCSDSVTAGIKVMTPVLDVAVLSVTKATTGGYITTTVQLANTGTRDILKCDLEARFGNGNSVRETWTGLLRSGGDTVYTFVSAFEDDGSRFLCVEAMKPNGEADGNPANNVQCVTDASAFIAMDPYPNPAGNSVTIDFILPEDGHVSVRLHDARGRLAGTLFDGEGTKGLNRMELDLNPYGNGIYSYTVTYRDASIVKRFMKN